MPRRSGNQRTIRPTTPTYTMPVPSPPRPPYVRYSIVVLDACDASIQLTPASSVPIEISRRGPKRSISAPWHGEKKACRKTRIENVTCTSGSEMPSFAISGLVISVHTYCGLEIDIMQTRPRASCSQRVEVADRTPGDAACSSDCTGVFIDGSPLRDCVWSGRAVWRAVLFWVLHRAAGMSEN